MKKRILSLVAVVAFTQCNGNATDEPAYSGQDAGESEALPVYLDEATGQYVVEHPENGRVWLRCAIGQQWNTSTKKCDGTAEPLTYNTAVGACPTGFGLPGDADFASVLCNWKKFNDECGWENELGSYDSCRSCSICAGMFPDNYDEEGDAICFPFCFLSSDSYWVEETKQYHVFVFSFLRGCIHEDLTYGNDSVYEVRCIKTPEQLPRVHSPRVRLAAPLD